MDKQERDTVLTINVVEPGLVRAVRMHADEKGRELKGLVLVDTHYVDQPDRPRDDSGLFTEIICDFDDPDALQRALQPYQHRPVVRNLPIRKRYPAAPPSHSVFAVHSHAVRNIAAVGN